MSVLEHRHQISSRLPPRVSERAPHLGSLIACSLGFFVVVCFVIEDYVMKGDTQPKNPLAHPSPLPLRLTLTVRCASNVQNHYLLSSHRPLGLPKVPTSTPTLQLGCVVSNITLSSPVHTSNTTPWVLECGLEAPAKPRSAHRARALTPRGGAAELDHVAGKWPRPVCTAVSPPATSRARTTVRLRL